MKTIKQFTTTIRRDATRYLSFPDVVKTTSGKLVCAFRNSDRHYPPTRLETYLELMDSTDEGKTWHNHRQFPHNPKGREQYSWHCPRLTLMKDGRIALLCDLGSTEVKPEIYLCFSNDNGETWSEPRSTGARGILPDRLIEINKNEWVFTYHWHGVTSPSLTQFLHATTNAGKIWKERAVIAHDPNYEFCEGSILKTSKGELYCYIRENTMIHHPTFVTKSIDNGFTWSKPIAHPTHGHRPCAGLIKDKLLLTFREVSGEPGLSAWLGNLNETGFYPMLRDLSGNSISYNKNGIKLSSRKKKREGVSVFLHPLPNWDTNAEFSFDMKCDPKQRNSCSVFFAGTLVFRAKSIEFYSRDREFNNYVLMDKYRINTAKMNSYHLILKNRILQILVNGKLAIERELPQKPHPLDKSIGFGNRTTTHPIIVKYQLVAGISTWNNLTLVIEKEKTKAYRWSWSNIKNKPINDYQIKRNSVLDVETSGELYESGYSGWVYLGENKAYCIDYRRGSAKKPYIVGHSLIIK